MINIGVVVYFLALFCIIMAVITFLITVIQSKSINTTAGAHWLIAAGVLLMAHK